MAAGLAASGTTTGQYAPLADGAAMHALIAELYPICRSITGEGVRETLRRLALHVPLTIESVASGTPVLDWTVPQEWTIRDAWIADSSGRRVVDFRDHSLHVVSYSRPVRARLSLAELRPHLHVEAAHPDWIPYRTTYYQDAWGFCLSARQLAALPEGEYEVVIDSDLRDGAMNWGECVLEGESADEFLVSVHVCHPSLANDNLSGLAVAAALIQRLQARRHRLTYRFVFVPGTIGAIAWLARNEARLSAIRLGLVAVNLGDPGMVHYKRSRRATAEVDRIAAHILARSGTPHEIRDFIPYGYDERQYCSPGFDLPVGCLMRTPFGEFPQYHTSGDDLDFVRPEALEASLETLWSIVEVADRNRRLRNLAPKGEPQLGRRGLYGALGGRSDAKARQMAMLWVLNLSDGHHDLVDIAERSGLDFMTISEVADTLVAHDLLAPEPGT